MATEREEWKPRNDNYGEKRPYQNYNNEERSYNRPSNYGGGYDNRQGNENYSRPGGSSNRPAGNSYGPPRQRRPYDNQYQSHGNSYNSSSEDDGSPMKKRRTRIGESQPTRNPGGEYGNYQQQGEGYGNRQQGGGYGNRQQGGGYGNQQGGGYGNRQQGGGYGNQQGGGYGNRQQGSGYGNQQGGGYGNRQQGGGYGNRQQGGGYGNQQGSGYGNRQQGGGYGNQQGGGYGNRQQGGGYGNRQQGGSYQTRDQGSYNPNAKYSIQKQLKYREENFDPNEPIRLNKYLANAGICSRREADEFIQAGLVKVNDEVVTELGTKVKRSDKVIFHEQSVQLEQKIYVLLNKPKNCVTTADDPQERLTVMDLVKNACQERIFPVGRLDRNTTGVLLLTNDGDLASKLTHPKFLKKKIYHVWLDKDVKIEDMQKIAEGIELEDGEIHADAISYVTETDIDKKQVGIEIHSGRNRIVRRMFESLGYHVMRLDRVYFAGLTKKNLKRGQWRYLNEREVNMLRMGAFD